jgi:hypothetical protein
MEGETSKRKIIRNLTGRLSSLPADIDVSESSLTRACKEILRLLGIRVFLVTCYGKTHCSFTTEGRILWEEALRWNELRLLEPETIVDFPSVLRLARSRDNGEQNPGGNKDIQRG